MTVHRSFTEPQAQRSIFFWEEIGLRLKLQFNRLHHFCWLPLLLGNVPLQVCQLRRIEKRKFWYKNQDKPATKLQRNSLEWKLLYVWWYTRKYNLCTVPCSTWCTRNENESKSSKDVKTSNEPWQEQWVVYLKSDNSRVKTFLKKSSQKSESFEIRHLFFNREWNTTLHLSETFHS